MATVSVRVVGKLLIGVMQMVDIIFGFVVIVLLEVAVLFLLLMIAATLKVIKQEREVLLRLKAADKEALEKFLRGCEVDGRTLEEWFALIKKQEGDNGTERTDETSPDR